MKDSFDVTGAGSVRSGVTLADVAADAGVSVSAVSKVLLGGGGKTTKVGEATAAQIVASARLLGYRPNAAARQLRTGRSQIVGAIIHSQAPQVCYARFARIQQKLARMGYGFMVGQSDGSVALIERYLEDFRSRCADVIITAHYEMPGKTRCLERLYSGFSNLLYLGHPTSAHGASVKSDTSSGIAQIVEYLAKQGVRRMALDVTDKFYMPVKARIAGYLEGLSKAGIPVDRDLMIETGAAPDDVLATLQKAISLRAQAIIAGNDLRAVILVKALRELKIDVPGDMKVTGFDNLEFGGFCSPSITTVDPCDDQIADAAVAMVRYYLEKGSFPANRVIVPELVVRESA